MNNQMVIFGNVDANIVPQNADIQLLASKYAIQLNSREVEKVLKTYEAEFYDMTAEYLWNRAISILKEKILDLGNEFVCEMLGRNDISSTSDFNAYDVIYLAAELGFISNTAKVQLEASNDFIQHYMSRDASEEMGKRSAEIIMESTIKYILSREAETVGVEFNNFRDKLKMEVYDHGSDLINMLINSPYFYKRTTAKTLVNLLKGTQDAEQDTVAANLSNMLPAIWDELLSDDRYPIGIAYAEAVNNSNKKISKILKNVLLKVQGFDYVPENLRSSTFLNAANKLISTHFGIDNFYNEPKVIKELASLGTIIPAPAVGKVTTAALCVKLGNTYGVSFDAQSYADKLLDSLGGDKWKYYMERVLIGDEIILNKLKNRRTAERMSEIVIKYGIDSIGITNPLVTRLVIALRDKNYIEAAKLANKIELDFSDKNKVK